MRATRLPISPRSRPTGKASSADTAAGRARGDACSSATPAQVTADPASTDAPLAPRGGRHRRHGPATRAHPVDDTHGGGRPLHAGRTRRTRHWRPTPTHVARHDAATRSPDPDTSCATSLPVVVECVAAQARRARHSPGKGARVNFAPRDSGQSHRATAKLHSGRLSACRATAPPTPDTPPSSPPPQSAHRTARSPSPAPPRPAARASPHPAPAARSHPPAPRHP